ncbi:MAG: hypothetical protein K2N21_01035 [Rikenellaceae bacterium]|nr:hypothetical protein [Rikenellaceae bacterium]
MEFPAVGRRRSDSSGTLSDAGTYGSYWSSVTDGSGRAYLLYFISSDLYVNNSGKHHGRSVRCVR